MLEQIIADKSVSIQCLESELAKERSDCQKLEQGIKEKQSVLESYERRFLSVRSLIERQDQELKDAYEQIRSA